MSALRWFFVGNIVLIFVNAITSYIYVQRTGLGSIKTWNLEERLRWGRRLIAGCLAVYMLLALCLSYRWKSEVYSGIFALYLLGDSAHTMWKIWSTRRLVEK